MKHLTRILSLGLGLILLAGCNLTTQAPISATATSIVGGKPTVIITSPQNNTEVALGTQVLVSAVATDNVGVTRVQLAANNQIVKTVSSESPSGQRNFQVVLDYTPRETGTVTLQILAYRDAIASDPALVTIAVKSAITVPTATSGISVPGQPGGLPQPPVIDPNDPTCRALTNTSLNLRTGPGTNYDRITVLAPGAVVPIIGRVADNSWWQVRSGNNIGWVSAQFTSVYGICTATPIVAAPPTPTPIVPTATNRPPGPPTLTNTPVPVGSPNLVVASISIGGPVSITTPLDGIVTYSAVITNRGAAAAGPFTVVGQAISTATAAPTPAFPGTGSATSIGVVNGLAAGSSITLNGTVTGVVANQAYTIWVTVDPANQVNEGSGESDNSLAFTFTTTP